MTSLPWFLQIDSLTLIGRDYSADDPIHKLPPEKRERQVIADVQRALTKRADELCAEPVTVRG